VAGGWPSKSDFDSWAAQRITKYNADSGLVGTCGKMTEIGSPQTGTIWIFGRWTCGKNYLEAIAETVGVAFRQRFSDGTAVSIHVWNPLTNEKLATKRMP
jgi:hypothetical protein